MLKTVLEACPVCKGREAREYSAFAELVFSECWECGTIYRSAEDPERLPKAYDEEYFTGLMGYSKRFEGRVRKARRQILAALEAAKCKPKRVLDVGCSVGYVLEAAGRMGFEAVGIDVSEFAVRECVKRGYEARVADIAETGLEDGSISVAILKHVLEHTPTPRRSLEEMARIVEPGGAVFIAVPNAGYWKARMFRQSYKFFRPGVIGGQHYVYFTEGSLRRLLAECGFEDMRFNKARYPARAVAEGRSGRMREWLRYLAGLPVRVGHLLLPGLRKELVMSAGRRADAE